MFPISVLNSVHKHQQGAVTVLTGFVLAVAVGALGVLGVGQTVWMKQNSQALADMAALTAATAPAKRMVSSPSPPFELPTQQLADSGRGCPAHSFKSFSARA